MSQYTARAISLKKDSWLSYIDDYGDVEGLSWLGSLEQALDSMPDDQLVIVEQKFTDIIPARTTHWKYKYGQAPTDIFVEILGWGWLQQRFPALPVKFNGTPDLFAKDGSGVSCAAAEAKNIHESDSVRSQWTPVEGMEEVQTISESMHLDEVMLDDPTRNGFLNKLQKTIKKAECQLSATGLSDNKYLILNIKLDIPLWTEPLRPKVQALVQKEANKLSAKGVSLVAFEGYDTNRLFTS